TTRCSSRSPSVWSACWGLLPQTHQLPLVLRKEIIVILRLLKRLFAPKLFGPRMLADPYPYYARLRSTAPVYWVDQFDAWVLTRYADVTAVLRSAHVSSDRANKTPQQAGPEYPALNEVRAFSMLNADPPRHTRLRLLVNKAFTPRT